MELNKEELEHLIAGLDKIKHAMMDSGLMGSLEDALKNMGGQNMRATFEKSRDEVLKKRNSLILLQGKLIQELNKISEAEQKQPEQEPAASNG